MGKDNSPKRKSPRLPPKSTPDGYITPGGITYSISEFPAPDTSTEIKIKYVMTLMRTLRWETGETGRILQLVWGLSTDTLLKYASEASRRVKDSFEPEEVSRMISSALTRCIQDCAKDNDRRHLIQASKALAELTGANKSIKINIEPMSKMSDEKLTQLAEIALNTLKNNEE